MKIRAEKIFLIGAMVCVCFAAVVTAQPEHPRPLPPEFFKRRDAGAAFEFGRIYLRQQKFDKAAENFSKAAKIYDEIGDSGCGCVLVSRPRCCLC